MDKVKKSSEEYMIGRRFGRLVPFERGEWYRYADGRRYDTWKCQCDCGRTKTITGSNLRSGNSMSCGCIPKENPNNKTHGKSNSKIYMRWYDMKRRCNDKKNREYNNYGGRGIKVCKEWLDFTVFYNWAISNGYSEDLTIERIDVNGDYCPENCKWIPLPEQARNKRNSRIIEYKGEKKCLQDWSEALDIPYSRLSQRLLKLGWPVEKAFTTEKVQHRSGKSV